MGTTDRELLRELRRQPAPERFQSLVDRYLPLVYSAACRQLSDEEGRAEAAQAVFCAFARQLPRLARRTVLADWLFEAVGVAVRRLRRLARRNPGLASVRNPPALQTGDTTRPALGLVLDPALARLPAKYRHVILLRFLLGWEVERVAQALRCRPSRVERLARRGLLRLSRRLGKKRLRLDAEELRAGLVAEGDAAAPPTGLADQISRAAWGCGRRRPELPLARSVLRGLQWASLKRRFQLAMAVVVSLALVLGVGAGSAVLLWRSGWLLPRLVVAVNRWVVRPTPGLDVPARPWPAQPADWRRADSVRGASELYDTTKIWLAHFRFTQEQWAAMRPSYVPAVTEIFRPDGGVVLRNPRARRNGVAGVVGFDFNWTPANLEWSGVALTNVAVRFRGNGTYLGSLWGAKRPFKVDLNKYQPTQEFAGVRTLNFMNLVADRSYLSDALGYELFRAAGVPAPRTTYAWLTVSVAGQFERKPLGLYLLSENVDAEFVQERFGSRRVPVFKPVTPDLFKDLGDDWAAYAGIYDLKTKATEPQKRRIIEFARLVTHAEDAAFQRRVEEYLDLEEFASFLAALVLVANYDSLLTYGQNYYLYLHPESNRFGFIPWDLDQAWGSFPQFGSAAARERASIWHPWAFENRFFERLFTVERFRLLYRRRLEALLDTAFRPERLGARIDQIAAAIREPIAAESDFRLRQFEQAVSGQWLTGPRDGGEGFDRPVHQLKRFIAHRAKSVRDQLQGRSKGIVLWRNPEH